MKNISFLTKFIVNLIAFTIVDTMFKGVHIERLCKTVLNDHYDPDNRNDVWNILFIHQWIYGVANVIFDLGIYDRKFRNSFLVSDLPFAHLMVS